MMHASKEMQGYFDELEDRLREAMLIAEEARSRGDDPTPHIEIPPAKDLADRVENLIGVEGVAERIRELEERMSREEAALRIGEDFANGDLGDYGDKAEVADAAIRTAVAMLTEGVVAAPIEGIARVDLGENHDGTQYLRVFYAGPIRSAGGTAQALSVLVADYVRRALGLAAYKPTQDELERYVEEIHLYRKIANLQYTPGEEEIKLIIDNCHVCIEGEPTEDEEVQGYRDLPRVDTNRVRGGMALVVAEGLALKAPKLKKHVANLDMDGWEWLDRFGGANEEEEDEEEKAILEPKKKFLQDLIAGRPVFSHPSREGGFRLRYGRARNTGLAAAGIHPATMILLDDFIATGTQIKTERPGKAAGISPVDSIEGPTVALLNGDVVRVDDAEEALELRPSIARVLDVGELLVNYGDFLENNQPLVPAGYCYEWWIQEFEEEPEEEYRDPGPVEALRLSDEYGVPLHPKYTYLWHDVSTSDINDLSAYVEQHGRIDGSLRVPSDPHVKSILEALLVPHRVRKDHIIIDEWQVLARCLGLDEDLEREREVAPGVSDPLELVSELAGIMVRARAPVRVGARMGRPEKSKRREMRPPPHVLFPLGESGGRRRSVQDAVKHMEDLNDKIGEIEVDVGVRECPACQTRTFKNRCTCGEFTEPVWFCPECDHRLEEDENCPKCGRWPANTAKQKIDLKRLYNDALERLGERDNFDKFKGVIGLTSKYKTPEPLEKGVLRAKHDVYVFKDGTIRYDLTDQPLTHFKPREIGTPVERLREMGYTHDVHGQPLEDGEQIVELRVQDVVVSHDAGEYLLRTSRFIDDLLVKYYGLDPYYEAETPEDLIGALLIGLAPHTSAGVLGRLIGYTKASVGYAHPYFHAAKRRNCDGDEDCVMLLMDGLLNFSRYYLPDRRGGQMDAPLVLTTHIDPREIDGEAHNIDLASRYPLEFYRATQKFTNSKELENLIDLVDNRLGTPEQYEHGWYTHDLTDIAAGPNNSAYKTLGSMIEKMEAQLGLARKVRAVDAPDVAERVINSHFLPDLIGNLRAFSRQKVRCVKCNRKFRRPPMRNKCRCGGRIVLTVHEGSVRKYLEVAQQIAEEYDVSTYTRQRLDLLDLEINSIFTNDKEQQMGLVDFV